MQKITQLSQLAPLIEAKVMADILNSAKNDPDWLMDLIEELEYITPTNVFYIAGFHGKLLELGYTTSDFDTDALYQDLTK